MGGEWEDNERRMVGEHKENGTRMVIKWMRMEGECEENEKRM